MSNFKFLEKINQDIYDLSSTAEKLFRDEYFDQCITQTRKTAEAMTRSILQSKAKNEDSFDDMIYKLKAISKDTLKEQEFISDMYFLKKQGNKAVHSEKSCNDGKIALECLEHLFEAAINYAYSQKKDDTLNRLIFDEKLLMTGEKNNSLEQEYKKRLKEEKNSSCKVSILTKEEKNSNKVNEKKSNKNYYNNENNNTLFKKIFLIFTVISVLLLFIIVVLSNTNKQTDYAIEKSIQNMKTEKKFLDKENKKTRKNTSSLRTVKSELLQPKYLTIKKRTENSSQNKDYSLSGNFSM